MKKIILFELNEVPWRVIEDFSRDYPNSTLARILDTSRKLETYAEDSELSPWVTWPSLHRGVSDHQHDISNFGQNLEDVNKEYPNIWQILADHNVSVGVFGSLHTHPLPTDLTNYEFLVPDVFAAGSECFPAKVTAYQEWNLAMSRSSARNVSTRVPLRETANFLMSLPGLGLRPRTAINLGRHLLDERRENWKKVRRRTHQVLIAYDIFLKNLQNTTPSFSTFFTNHVASTMHRYWAAKYPMDYNEYGYSDGWQSTYRHEIDWTVGKFDYMLSKLVQFVDQTKKYELWIASSMGQAATRADTESSTQTYIADLAKFMGFFGLESHEYTIKPTMAPRIVVEIANPEKASTFEADTSNIEILGVNPRNLGDGEYPFIKIKNLGKQVYMIRTPVLQNHCEEYVSVNGDTVSFNELGILNVAISDQAGQTAYHIPQGSLLVYSPAKDYSASSVDSISALDVAPMILKNFNVKAPSYMKQPANSLLAV